MRWDPFSNTMLRLICTCLQLHKHLKTTRCSPACIPLSVNRKSRIRADDCHDVGVLDAVMITLHEHMGKHSRHLHILIHRNFYPTCACPQLRKVAPYEIWRRGKSSMKPRHLEELPSNAGPCFLFIWTFKLSTPAIGCQSASTQYLVTVQQNRCFRNVL